MEIQNLSICQQQHLGVYWTHATQVSRDLCLLGFFTLKWPRQYSEQGVIGCLKTGRVGDVKESENLFIHSVVKCYLSFSFPPKQCFHLSIQIGDPDCFSPLLYQPFSWFCAPEVRKLWVVSISHCEDSYPSTLELFLGGSKTSFCLSLIALLKSSDSPGKTQHKRKMLTWEASILSHGNCPNLQCTSVLQGMANSIEWVQSQGRGWMGDFHDIAQEPNLVLPAWWVNMLLWPASTNCHKGTWYLVTTNLEPRKHRGDGTQSFLQQHC